MPRPAEIKAKLGPAGPLAEIAAQQLGEGGWRSVAPRAGLLLSRWRAWLQVLGGVGAAQAGIQGIGFICAILVARTLPAATYALYTLAYTMLGTLTVLA